MPTLDQEALVTYLSDRLTQAVAFAHVCEATVAINATLRSILEAAESDRFVVEDDGLAARFAEAYDDIFSAGKDAGRRDATEKLAHVLDDMPNWHVVLAGVKKLRILQLHRQGVSDTEIAAAVGWPLIDIRTVIEFAPDVSQAERAFDRAHRRQAARATAEPSPTPDDATTSPDASTFLLGRTYLIDPRSEPSVLAEFIGARVQPQLYRFRDPGGTQYQVTADRVNAIEFAPDPVTPEAALRWWYADGETFEEADDEEFARRAAEDALTGAASTATRDHEWPEYVDRISWGYAVTVGLAEEVGTDEEGYSVWAIRDAAPTQDADLLAEAPVPEDAGKSSDDWQALARERLERADAWERKVLSLQDALAASNAERIAADVVLLDQRTEFALALGEDANASQSTVFGTLTRVVEAYRSSRDIMARVLTELNDPDRPEESPVDAIRRLKAAAAGDKPPTSPDATTYLIDYGDDA